MCSSDLRDAKNIKRYKRKTTDLIEQLEQSVQQNEVLITSRKKAVHTITHELRTPLTAITGYTELLRKECNSGNNGQYIRNILQSSDRMRDMLNTLLDFFRLDNGKEQPRLLFTERAKHLLTQLGVADLADSYPRELSGGEMRRVSIARAQIGRASCRERV